MTTFSSHQLWSEIPRAKTSPMEDVVQLLEQLCHRPSPIMLIGESGTGKEVIAKAIHNHSPRAKNNFIAINCGAIPENLVESELFGYIKGAFTGANQDRPGKVRQAHQGTLFLDEIGELSLLAQTRLLRVLQERTVCPIGSAEEIHVDFRLICASHRNLQQMVRNGTFREDLFYRLMVFPVVLPSLRERTMDLKALAQQIWLQIHSEQGLEQNELGLEDIAELGKHTWPGNIRQLRHALERYSVYQSLGWNMARACEPIDLENDNSIVNTPKPTWRNQEQERISEILLKHRYNKSKAAEELQMSRGAFLRYLKKIGIND